MVRSSAAAPPTAKAWGSAPEDEEGCDWDGGAPRGCSLEPDGSFVAMLIAFFINAKTMFSMPSNLWAFAMPTWATTCTVKDSACCSRPSSVATLLPP